tara:strand:- start:2627 stop:3715 length:1089 start_codon:yes stop_codon:yes gene_type:complete
MWLDTTNSGSNSLTIKFFDGTDDITFATVNTSANTVDFTDSSVTFDIVNDTSPQLGGDLDTNSANIKIDDAHGILDDDGNELIIFQKTGSAVNQFDITNNASGSNPILEGTGGDSNIGIDLKPKGTGEIVIGTGAASATLTTKGTHDLVLDTNAGTNSGTITITDGADGNINIAPNGNGVVQAGGSAVKVAGKETIWIPASAMYGSTTNPADAQQVETTATRPDMKVLDFDKDTDQFAQFSVAFPKSWNEGTITYQVYWTPASTNTGDCIFGLQGVSCGDNDTIDVAFGTAVTVTDAGIGTVEDQQVSAESGAVTIAGSPAVDQLTYFQLFRDANAGGDTFTADARVLGVKLFFTTDAANDA